MTRMNEIYSGFASIFARTVRRRAVVAAATLFLASAAPYAALADTAPTFPEKPIRIIVPLAPGGSVDLTARLLAEALQTEIGQPIVIENLAGGGGTIGATAAAQAEADGYTLLMGSSSSIAVNPSLMKDLPYDPKRDFEAVSLVSYAPNVLVASTGLGFKTVSDVVEAAKANPGKLGFASSGVGGSPHLAGELFQREAGVELLHVPYKGSGQALTDVLGERVELTFATVIATREHIESGALTPLMVTTSERVTALPDVPNAAEAGYPGVIITAWNGLLAPKGTPSQVVEKISAAVQRATKNQTFADRLAAEGSTIVGSNPADFSNFIVEEVDRWAAVIKAANIAAE